MYYLIVSGTQCTHITLTVASVNMFSETSLIRHSMGPESSVRLGGCRITEWLLAYFTMVTVPHEMVKFERMLDYRGV